MNSPTTPPPTKIDIPGAPRKPVLEKQNIQRNSSVCRVLFPEES